MSRAPGMQDVAQLAGVSHQTVSRVLNGHPSVRPETRARVQAAIGSLGYRRNSAARALATNRSSTLGLLAASSSRSGPVSTLVAVEEASRAAGLYVNVTSLSVYDPASVRAALDHFLDQAVEGIIAIAPVQAAVDAAAAGARDLPTVVLAPPGPAGDASLHVAVDQRQGARSAVRHLLGLGHRRIAHLGGPSAWLDAAERAAGWRDELAAVGLPVTEILPGDWTAASGFAAAQTWPADGPTAVFAANDLMALGLVRGLTERGLRVPADVSVVGFDDIEVSGYSRPPLTTVRQDFGDLGRAAVRVLLARLAGEWPTAPTLIEPELVVRASTAGPRQP
ncbi:LacI family DNA-binding transcriptional regulator [uncultured Friedmanniella sp.]|uniref:LacI family DNA-binding transcriptional regulator n=1 Tax=uncultured Friedmanniella sp. TaxID=335381 RepID=UPI0035CA4AC0